MPRKTLEREFHERWSAFYSSVAIAKSPTEAYRFFAKHTHLSEPVFYELRNNALQAGLVEFVGNKFKITAKGWLDFIERMKVYEKWCLNNDAYWIKTRSKELFNHLDPLINLKRRVEEEYSKIESVLSRITMEKMIEMEHGVLTPAVYGFFVSEYKYYMDAGGFTPQHLIRLAFIARKNETPWLITNPNLDYEWRGFSLRGLLEALFRWKERYGEDVKKAHYREVFRVAIKLGLSLLVVTGSSILRSIPDYPNSAIEIESVILFSHGIFWGKFEELQEIGIESGVFYDAFKKDEKPVIDLYGKYPTNIVLGRRDLVYLKERQSIHSNEAPIYAVFPPETGRLPIITRGARIKREKTVAITRLRYAPPPVNILQIEATWV